MRSLPFGGPSQVLRYLGRYTHRVAISNHRLLGFDGENVTFSWRDYAHGNKRRKMTLNGPEFLRRFVQHILPRGFVRIRQYGFLANRRRSTALECARHLLNNPSRPRAIRRTAPRARLMALSPMWRRDDPRRQPLASSTGEAMRANRQFIGLTQLLSTRRATACVRGRAPTRANSSLKRCALPKDSHHNVAHHSRNAAFSIILGQARATIEPKVDS
jgi:putative transposase